MWRDREITERWPGKEGVEGGSVARERGRESKKKLIFGRPPYAFIKYFDLLKYGMRRP